MRALPLPWTRTGPPQEFPIFCVCTCKCNVNWRPIINGKCNNEFSCNTQIIIVHFWISTFSVTFPSIFFFIYDDASRARSYYGVSSTSRNVESDSCPVWLRWNFGNKISSEFLSNPSSIFTNGSLFFHIGIFYSQFREQSFVVLR